MVTLTEVEDEHFQNNQAGPEEEDDFTDTGMFSNVLEHLSMILSL
jgi:hypothetical protein